MLISAVWLFLAACVTVPAGAVVLYEEDREYINGVALLRDKDDPSAYYYLPTYPRLSLNDEGMPEMYIVKFVGRKDGEADQPSGGLLHFLFTLDIPQAEVEELEIELRRKVPGATLRGPVPLQVDRELDRNEDSPKASFRIISAVLNEETGELTSSIVSSGVAPVTPGSKAAVAAVLSEEGATLLFDSLEGNQGASDVSVAITAYYEAAVTGFVGTVNADLSTVYDYMLNLQNYQESYSKVEFTDTVDSMIREGAIEMDITDRSGLGIDSSQSEALLDLVTNKLIDMLFDTTVGISALPETEKPPELAGREERSFFAQVFGGEDQPRYISDRQYTLRNREDVRQGSFSLRFTRNTTIKVPYDTSGNIRGIYNQFEGEADFLRVVSLIDPAFERRPVVFEVDPLLYDQFGKTITSASVAMKKQYSIAGQSDFRDSVRFSQQDVEGGTSFSKFVVYPYLGITDDSGDAFEYRTTWNFVGGRVVTAPADSDGYISSREGSVQISPPVDIANMEIEIDRLSMEQAGMRRAEVQIRYELLSANDQKNVGLHVSRGPDVVPVSLLYDPETTPERRVVWTGNSTRVSCEPWVPVIDQSYILLNAEESPATEAACE
jgi:hypothetical protein